ncbi:ATP-grasp domain-containing protein [Saccharopolyspora griseoalba]|uniref:RimK family alpha-L-glutamate ligase n=1 Tax=Saccharopolyspora griseoalba TaxID=1431848 RepID=A0ABW2LL62_9PSEU
MSAAENRPADRAEPAAPSALGRTPVLLQGQDYFVRAPSTPLDFQERMYRAGMVDERPGEPAPCVLVLSRAADVEMNGLSVALAESDVRMMRIDADRCLDLPLTIYTDTPLIEFERWLLRPVLIWRRHFDMTAVPVEPGTVHGAYVREQWSAVANWLTGREDWGRVNAARAGERLDRLTQQRDAAAAGLRVPRTAVTTMPGRSRPGGSRCIVKTAGHHLLEPEPGALRGLFPQPFDIRRTGGEAREPAPVLVQQYLESDGELRVFVVGGRTIAFRVDKLDPAQLWVDPESVAVERVELADPLADKLVGLCERWGLDVAGFDLLRVDDDWVFLEVNVNCDWQWFEQRAESSEVSEAVHAWVRSRFDELAASAAGEWSAW